MNVTLFRGCERRDQAQFPCRKASCERGVWHGDRIENMLSV